MCDGGCIPWMWGCVGSYDQKCTEWNVLDPETSHPLPKLPHVTFSQVYTTNTMNTLQEMMDR